LGTIVHTGDFKLDPSPLDGELPDYRRFAELGEQGVMVLCSDSTNVDRPGHTRSEMDVGEALGARFDTATGRIIVATFASHIHRIQHVLTLAARTGRRVALLGMSMQRNVAIAADLGYLRVPQNVLVELEDLAELPADRQVILSTGSQGEPHSALALMASSEHKYVRIERGDLVIISARVIPGNERTIGRVVNALYRLGAEVLYEDNAFVHVSGHASQEDLKMMFNLTRPRYFIPVHGEYRQSPQPRAAGRERRHRTRPRLLDRGRHGRRGLEDRGASGRPLSSGSRAGRRQVGRRHRRRGPS